MSPRNSGPRSRKNSIATPPFPNPRRFRASNRIGSINMNRILMVALCLAPAAFAQEKTMTCSDNEGWRERGHYCEIREATMPAGGSLDVDGGVNGGISIKGSNRNDILVRSMVQAYEDDSAQSRQMAAAIRLETSSGKIRATGPAMDHHGWGVSYEIFV